MLNEYIEKKLKLKNLVVFASAVLCGLIMGLVTTFSVVLSSMSVNAVLSKFIYGAAFAALLLLVVLNGYELFTGNTMLLTVVHKKGSTKKVLLNLLLVYFGNLLGCVFMAVVIKQTGLHQTFALENYLLNVYLYKTQMGIGKMLLLGVLANYMVCMGVYLAAKGKTVTDTYLSLFFPICIFCVLGFEHSVANMFTLFYSTFVNGSAVLPVFVNLLFVTAGNIMGGVLFAFTTKIKGSAAKEN